MACGRKILRNIADQTNTAVKRKSFYHGVVFEAEYITVRVAVLLCTPMAMAMAGVLRRHKTTKQGQALCSARFNWINAGRLIALYKSYLEAVSEADRVITYHW